MSVLGEEDKEDKKSESDMSETESETYIESHIKLGGKVLQVDNYVTE